MRWFSIWWWRYLFEDNTGIRNILCRAKGHKGYIWFNPHGTEPDYRCHNCKEDLG